MISEGCGETPLTSSYSPLTTCIYVACCCQLQPAKVVCIEYPREAGKDEQYPWVCLWKAAWVADNVLGVRAAVREGLGRRVSGWCAGSGWPLQRECIAQRAGSDLFY